jgi:cell division protein FtsW (lipid II flippase)
MGALRIESARVQEWAARPTAVVWRAFDLQLTIYALLLAAIGLAMAYTNSGQGSFEQGSTFLRGLVWAGIAVVVFTLAAAFDYRWLRTFAWPLSSSWRTTSRGSAGASTRRGRCWVQRRSWARPRRWC